MINIDIKSRHRTCRAIVVGKCSAGFRRDSINCRECWCGWDSRWCCVVVGFVVIVVIVVSAGVVGIVTVSGQMQSFPIGLKPGPFCGFISNAASLSL